MSAVIKTKATRRSVAHLQPQDLANGQGRLVGGYPQLHSEFEASVLHTTHKNHTGIGQILYGTA